MELGLSCPALVQFSRKESARRRLLSHQPNLYRVLSRYRPIIGVGDDYPDGGGRAAEIRVLRHNVHYRMAQDCRNGPDAIERGARLAVVDEPIAQTIPDEILKRECLD